MAFTSSIKLYLQQLQGDLKKFGADEQEKLLSNILKQLEINYPTPITKKIVKKSPSLTPRIADALTTNGFSISEEDAQLIELITTELIGQENLDSSSILKIVAAFQIQGFRENLNFLAENKTPLTERFLNPNYRYMFASIPSVTQNVSSYLKSLGLPENLSAFSSEIVFQLEEYLTQTAVFHNFVENTFEGTSSIPPEDLAELETLEQNTRANLILFQVFSRSFIFLVREKVTPSLERFKEFLNGFAVGQLAEWSPEYLVLGAFGLRKYNDTFIIGSSEVCLDPIFSESNKNISEKLMMTFLRSKYRLIQNILKQEMPEKSFQIQIS
jgi:hypothetical protein